MDTNLNHVRQKVQQARDLAKQGHYVQAKVLLKGINHPKVAEMMAHLDERIAAQPKTKVAQFHLLPIAGLIGIVMILAIGGGLLLTLRSRETAEILSPILTTTLIPVECTDATITAWWQVQIQNDRELNTFAVNADAASSTMPGERLTTAIENLRTTRASALKDVPSCASADLQRAIENLLSATDDVILVLDRWNNGVTTSGDLMNEYYAASEAVRNAKKVVREVLPQS